VFQDDLVGPGRGEPCGRHERGVVARPMSTVKKPHTRS
jgi:hypothetical protein